MKTKSILFGALAMVALASCSSDDNAAGQLDPNEARFSATMPTAKAARAVGASWEAGDQIGIYCTTGPKTYTNVAYQNATGAAATVSFEAVTDKIYYQSTAVVTFNAYYPYKNTLSGADAAADTQQQQNQKEFDFMFATATGSKAANNVNFNFKHKMTKLVLTVKGADDVTFSEIQDMNLYLNNVATEGKFTANTGATALTGAALNYQFQGNGEAAKNAPYTDSGSERTFTFYFFPQTFSTALEVRGEIAGLQDFKESIDFSAANSNVGLENANKWFAGYEYHLTATMHKTAIVVEGCTITDWTVVDAGNIDAY